MTSSPRAERSYRALLTVPGLPRLLLSMQLARIAQSMVSVALVLFTLAEYKSPALTGIVTNVALLPQTGTGGSQAYPVIVSLSGVPSTVRAGMSVRMTLPD